MSNPYRENTCTPKWELSYDEQIGQWILDSEVSSWKPIYDGIFGQYFDSFAALLPIEDTAKVSIRFKLFSLVRVEIDGIVLSLTRSTRRKIRKMFWTYYKEIQNHEKNQELEGILEAKSKQQYWLKRYASELKGNR